MGQMAVVQNWCPRRLGILDVTKWPIVALVPYFSSMATFEQFRYNSSCFFSSQKQSLCTYPQQNDDQNISVVVSPVCIKRLLEGDRFMESFKKASTQPMKASSIWIHTLKPSKVFSCACTKNFFSDNVALFPVCGNQPLDTMVHHLWDQTHGLV